VCERTVYGSINRWLTHALRFMPGGDSCASSSLDGTIKVGRGLACVAAVVMCCVAVLVRLPYIGPWLVALCRCVGRDSDAEVAPLLPLLQLFDVETGCASTVYNANPQVHKWRF
jgi:hypothetical protein